jgi:ribose transport system substrate-binding protein
LLRKSAAALVLLAWMVTPACQQTRKRVIGVVPKATSHLFWVTVEQGVRKAAADTGVQLEWSGAASETDYARQVQIVESMLTRGVGGLAVAATEKKILVSQIERAKKMGIPVVVFDSGVETEAYDTFISTNNREGGAAGARALARAIGGKGKIALLAHAPGSNSTMDREQGFEETLAREFPQVVIAARQFSMSDRAKGRAAAENILTATPDLAGIFCSAEPGSVGASLAIQSRGLAGRVHLVTFDSSDSLLADCEKGVIDAMVLQEPFRIGYLAVESLVALMDGKKVEKRQSLAPGVKNCR